MEDCRVFGSDSSGVHCNGNMKATRCTIEDNNGHAGVWVSGFGLGSV